MCFDILLVRPVSNIPVEVGEGVERVGGGLADGDDGGIPDALRRRWRVVLFLHPGHPRHQRRLAAAGAAGDGQVDDELPVALEAAAGIRVVGAALEAGLGEDLRSACAADEREEEEDSRERGSSTTRHGGLPPATAAKQTVVERSRSGV